jgi:hypothetical protein
VYIPKYSITCFGPPKGRLAYTTQFLANKVFINAPSTLPEARSSATNLALNNEAPVERKSCKFLEPFSLIVKEILKKVSFFVPGYISIPPEE